MLFFTISRVSFPSGAELLSDTTSMFQLSGNELNNSSAYTSSSRFIFIAVS